MKKDLFISHASEDKEQFVKPLAHLLTKHGVDVWYDEFELKIGRSLSRTIDHGIGNSRHGLLVLSKAFFSKNWPEYELKSFNSFEVQKGDVLLPIWKDVTLEDVQRFSPYLADKFALNADQSLEEIAINIIEVVRPDIFSEIHVKLLTKNALSEGTVYETYNYDLFKPGHKKHLKLNENLTSRIRLIRAALISVYPNTIEYWIDGFQRDLNIEKEIRCWEHISSCFLELRNSIDPPTQYRGALPELAKDIFTIVFSSITSGEAKADVANKFTTDFLKDLHQVCNRSLPYKDNEPFLNIQPNLNGPKKGVSLSSSSPVPKYRYEIQTFMTTFSDNERGTEHTEVFADEDILEARERAIIYYNRELDSFSRKGQYKGLPFASPEDFKMGENAAFSVFFYFVINSDGEDDFLLLSGSGDSKESTLRDLATEILHLMESGVDIRRIPALLFNGVTLAELNDEVQSLLRSRFG